MKTKKEIFLGRIDKNGDWVEGMNTQCWNFVPKNSNYMGTNKSRSFNLGNGVIRPLRICAYQFLVDEKYSKGRLFSKCKNSNCVNPEHIVLNNVFIADKIDIIVGGKLHRRCPSCRNYFPKSVDNFYISKNGTYLKCRECSIRSVTESRAITWKRVLIYEAAKSVKKGLDMNLTLEDINYLYESQKGRCYWTGIEMIPSSISRYPFKPSLDRLDRFKGYTLDNVVLCCLAMNIGRNSSSKEVFEEFILKIKKEGLNTSLWKK